MSQILPSARALQLAVVSSLLGASCASHLDPTTARAEFSSKSQSLGGAAAKATPAPAAAVVPPTAEPAPTTTTVAVTTEPVKPIVAPPQLPVTPIAPPPTKVAVTTTSSAPSAETALHEPPNANLTRDANRVLRAAAVSDWAALRAHAIEACIRSPRLLAELAPRALVDENRGVRFVACMSVANARVTAVKDLVEPLLHDPSPSVQAAAMLAMSRLGTSVDFTPLAAMLEQNDPEIRANAYLVLGELGNASAIPLITSSLGQGMKLINPLRVRLVDLAAAEALVKLGEEREIEPIRAALFAPPEQGELTIVACDAIGRLKDEVSRPMLERVITAQGSAERSPEIRLAAARALAKLGSEKAPLMIARQYATHPDARVRAQTASLLGEIASPEAESLLGTLLLDANPSVQIAAAAGFEAAD